MSLETRIATRFPLRRSSPLQRSEQVFTWSQSRAHLLRQAKGQIGLGKVFGDRNELLKIFGRYTDTDIARDNDAQRSFVTTGALSGADTENAR